MNEQTKPIVLFARIAMILYAVRVGLSLVIGIFPKTVLSLLGSSDHAETVGEISPVIRLLPIICAAAVFFVCWHLLNSAVKSDTKERAQLALTVILAVLVISPVANVISQQFLNWFIARMIGSAAFTGYSLLRIAEGYAGLLSGISYPLLVSAAAMNWQRHRG